MLAGCAVPDATLTTASENDTAIDDAPSVDAPGIEPTPDALADSPADPEPSPDASPEPSIEASIEPPVENQTQDATDPSAPAPEPETPLPEPTVFAFQVEDLATTSESVEAGREGVFLTGTIVTNDIAQISGTSVSVRVDGTMSGKHVFTDEDRAQLAPPGEVDGFQVWRAGEGRLAFTWRFAPDRAMEPGEHQLAADATSPAGEIASAAPVTIRVDPYDAVITSTTPISGDGAVATGEAWGSWTAKAGAKNVAARNYIKVVNAGDNPDARAILDFGADGFRGTSDPRFAIATVDNLEFAWWEATHGELPREGNFTWHAASQGTGDLLVFTHTSSAIYVTYRIREMPNVLPVQQYASTFTLTEV